MGAQLNLILHGKSCNRNALLPSLGPASRENCASSRIQQGQLFSIVIPRTRSFSSLLFAHIVHLSTPPPCKRSPAFRQDLLYS